MIGGDGDGVAVGCESLALLLVESFAGIRSTRCICCWPCRRSSTLSSMSSSSMASSLARVSDIVVTPVVVVVNGGDVVRSLSSWLPSSPSVGVAGRSILMCGIGICGTTATAAVDFGGILLLGGATTVRRGASATLGWNERSKCSLSEWRTTRSGCCNSGG